LLGHLPEQNLVGLKKKTQEQILIMVDPHSDIILHFVNWKLPKLHIW